VLRVTSGPPYAAIHEFGGVTAAHEIRARKAAALAFMRGGSLAFATSVRHPGSRIPARSFLRTSLAEMEGVVLAAIDEAVTAAARP
jgi:phage gpG-like protein